MKTGSLIAAATTTLAAFTAPAQVAAAECSTLSLVVTFLPLLTNANTCASNTGYSLYPFTGLPTADELTLICADTTCTKLLAEASALDLPDCTVTYDGVSYNVKNELTLYATACGVARKYSRWGLIALSFRNNAFVFFNELVLMCNFHLRRLKIPFEPKTTVACIAAIAAMVGAFVIAEECAPTTLSFALLPLESESKLCAADSGYKLYPFTGMPSQDEVKALCKSKACNKMLDEARDADMPDCDVTVNGTAYNIHESIELMFAECKVIDVNKLSA